MKKKFRKINLNDDINWAWNVNKTDSYYRHSTMKIWKDKISVYESTWGGESSKYRNYNIKPSLVARFINRFLK
jgi:hypothetical protein